MLCSKHVMIPCNSLLQTDKKRVVEEAEARVWAETKGYHYFETSAQTGEGVSEMFQVCLHYIHCIMDTILIDYQLGKENDEIKLLLVES